MTPPFLLTIGTPSGEWHAWARRLLVPDAADERAVSSGLSAWLTAVLGDRAEVAATPDAAQREALDRVAADTTGHWVGVDDRACWVLDALMHRFAGAGWLVMIEPPAVGLADALAAGKAPDPAQWLARWHMGASHLRRLLQRHPRQCLVVDATEVRQQPAALSAALAARWGLPLDLGDDALRPDRPAADALCQALAVALAQADASVQALHEELQASCMLLPGCEGTPQALTPANGPAIDGAAAMAQLRAHWQLQQRLAEIASAAAADLGSDAPAPEAVGDALSALDTLRAAWQAARQRRHDAEAALAQAGESVRDLQARLAQQMQAAEQARHAANQDQAESDVRRRADHQALAAAEQARQLLLQQLQQLQQELANAHVASDQARQAEQQLQQQLQQQQETSADERRAHEQGRQRQQQRLQQLQALVADQTAGAEAQQTQLQAQAQALASAVAAREQAKAQVAAGRAQLAQAQAETQAALAQAQLARGQADAERGQARRNLQAADQQQELLKRQLQQGQQELAQAQLRCRDLAQALADAANPGGVLALHIDGLKPTRARDQAPHRELGFHLHQVRWLDQALSDLTVRLVEHHGHPGLVVFAGPQGQRIYRQWPESGQEDGRAYVLLVPSDDQGRAALAAMDSVDWLLTLGLVARIQAQLQASVEGLSPLWAPVARRLADQLQELPPRFRHGGVQVAPVAQADVSTLAVQFRQVSYGARQLPQLGLHWRPYGVEAGLDLLLDPVCGPPLTDWPDGRDGAEDGPDGNDHPEPDALRLPLPAAASQDADRQAWLALADTDRAFLVAMLDQWPQALASTPQAAHLPAQVRQLLAPPEVPVGWLRRLARRGRRALAGPGRSGKPAG